MHKKRRLERQSAAEPSSGPLYFHCRILRVHCPGGHRKRGQYQFTLHDTFLPSHCFELTYFLSTSRFYNVGFGRFEGESCYISWLGGRLAARRRGTIAAYWIQVDLCFLNVLFTKAYAKKAFLLALRTFYFEFQLWGTSHKFSHQYS